MSPYTGMGNNPIIIVDPDGEFIHLIIGAVIGGTFNVIFNWNKIKGQAGWGWKALGYFGVGAAAGTLAAGVGAGVGAALAAPAGTTGAFTAGFIGTNTVTATGFFAGAAAGGSAGFTNGLILGTGNGLLGGQSFGDALLTGGIDQAWKQGLSGLAIGGLMGGIDALTQDKNFWTGSDREFMYTNGETYIAEDSYHSLYENHPEQAVDNYSYRIDPNPNPASSYNIELPKGLNDWNRNLVRSSSKIDIVWHNRVATFSASYELGFPNGGQVVLGAWRWGHRGYTQIRLQNLFHRSNFKNSPLFFFLNYL